MRKKFEMWDFVATQNPDVAESSGRIAI